MKMSSLRKAALYVAIFVLAGCAENKYIQTTDRLCVPAVTKTDTMATVEQVLAGMHFDIEKLDAEAGYVRTHPLPGAQSFEIWRADNVGAFNSAEADLHSIRRTVELNITEQPGQLCIQCKATVQRLSFPDNQTAATQNKAIMSPNQRSLQKLTLNPDQKQNITWLDLGRDNQLETEILNRINKRLVSLKKGQNK